jgi:hypothetical protein
LLFYIIKKLQLLLKNIIKVKTLLSFIYDELNKTIEVNIENNEIIYSQIGRFLNFDMRLKLIQKYENGILQPKDLLGSYVFFEGLSKDKNKIIHYSAGS